MTIIACKFSNIFRGASPRTPLKSFLFSICFKMILPEKTTLKNVWKFGALSLKIISEYAADIKTFFKELIYAFFGFTVYIFS